MVSEIKKPSKLRYTITSETYRIQNSPTDYGEEAKKEKGSKAEVPMSIQPTDALPSNENNHDICDN